MNLHAYLLLRTLTERLTHENPEILGFRRVESMQIPVQVKQNGHKVRRPRIENLKTR